MGVYYLLVNDTKKESLHLDYHIKYGPITQNKAVHLAFVNYMFEHQGDLFRLLSDDSDDYDRCVDYKEVDLLSYPFDNKKIAGMIISELNAIYKDGRYKTKNTSITAKTIYWKAFEFIDDILGKVKNRLTGK